MKLKKVAALCKAAGTYHLCNQVDGDGTVGVQWLGDGEALYPMHGMPYLRECELYRTFDVTEKEQDKIDFWHAEFPRELCAEDNCREEWPAEDMGIAVTDGGCTLLPMRYRGGILYIKAKHLGPLESERDNLRYFVRRTENGEAYVVVKTDLMLSAIIMPPKMARESFVEKLEELVWAARRELEEKRGKETPCAGDDGQEDLLEGTGDEEA